MRPLAANTDRQSDRHGDCDSNVDTAPNVDAYGHTDGDTLPDADGDRHVVANADSDCYIDIDRYGDRYGDRDAIANADVDPALAIDLDTNADRRRSHGYACAGSPGAVGPGYAVRQRHAWREHVI